MAAASAERASVDHAQTVAFLADGAAFGDAGPVRRIDTHAAHIFLSGDTAWKLKRDVCYPYLDFSTADARRDALEAELRLNRRTAPDLYRAVRPITRAPDGTLAIDGAGDPIEWVLEMRRFPDGALLDEIAAADGLNVPLLLRLTDNIRTLHAQAARVDVAGAEQLRRIVDGNAESCAAVATILDRSEVDAMIAAQRRELAQRAAHLDARARNGRIRRGHGDLHLRNIAMIDGAPVLFDCLEFNDELASVDILYDLAFLLMDLWHRGFAREANIVANHYVDAAPQGASGFALLLLFISVRASIRAHVLAALAAREGNAHIADEARGYLALACAALDRAPPRLVAVGGLSGTGKTTIARQLGARHGRPPGARVLRSDVFRKRLAGVAPETRLPSASYTPASSAQTYEALFESADDHLACGTSVFLDAVFLKRSERDVAEMIAHRARVPFTGLWLEAPEHDRVARVAARVGDASDAGPEVARDQSRRSVGELASWHRIRVNRPLDRILVAARRILDRVRRHRA